MGKLLGCEASTDRAGAEMPSANGEVNSRVGFLRLDTTDTRASVQIAGFTPSPRDEQPDSPRESEMFSAAGTVSIRESSNYQILVTPKTVVENSECSSRSQSRFFPTIPNEEMGETDKN